MNYEKISISSSNVYVCLWWFIPCKGSEFCRSCDSPDRNQCNSCQDTVTKKDEPVKTELSAPTAFVNDTVVKDTASKDKPAEPVKE